MHAHPGDMRLTTSLKMFLHVCCSCSLGSLISFQRCELDVAITASTAAATKSAIAATPQCVWRCSFCNHAIPQVKQTAEAGAAPKRSGLAGRIQGIRFRSLRSSGCHSFRVFILPVCMIRVLSCILTFCSLFIGLCVFYTADSLSKLQASAAPLLCVLDAPWHTNCRWRQRLSCRCERGLDHVVRCT